MSLESTLECFVGTLRLQPKIIFIKVCNMEMAQYIISIFKHYLPIVFSWGFHNPMAIDNGLRFFVEGYLHTGKVEVVYDEGYDTFIVRILKKDGSIKKEVQDVYIDGLVDVIDRLVEKCDDYENRVKKDYGLIG